MGISNTLAFLAILAVLASSTFAVPTTPPSAALTGDVACANTTAHKDPQQCELLVAFYNATIGSKWIAANNWLQPNVSYCSWKGVCCDSLTTCNPNGTNVVGMNLASNGLVGQLPWAFCQLSSLESIQLGNNSMDSRILFNESCVTLLSEVSILEVGQNRLGGPIPSHWPKTWSKRLQRLDVAETAINGTLPTTLADFETLEVFIAAGNALAGELPDSLPISLQNLDLSRNQFNGSIPKVWSELRNLVSLKVGTNNLDMQLDEQAEITKELFGQLQVLDLSDNHFSGSVPLVLCNSKKLQSLSLSDNFIEEMCDLSEFSSMVSLELFDISDNMHLTGSITIDPKNLTTAFPPTVPTVDFQNTELHLSSASDTVWELRKSHEFITNSSSMSLPNEKYTCTGCCQTPTNNTEVVHLLADGRFWGYHSCTCKKWSLTGPPHCLSAYFVIIPCAVVAGLCALTLVTLWVRRYWRNRTSRELYGDEEDEDDGVWTASTALIGNPEDIEEYGTPTQ